MEEDKLWDTIFYALSRTALVHIPATPAIAWTSSLFA